MFVLLLQRIIRMSHEILKVISQSATFLNSNFIAKSGQSIGKN